MKLSKNFTLAELEHSQVAVRFGYDNNIPQKYIPNVKRLVTTILQPLRDELKSSLHISSGYRSKKVNQAVKGAKNSAHMRGLAADIWSAELEPIDLTQLIIDLELPFEMVIHEFGRWAHVACPVGKKMQKEKYSPLIRLATTLHATQAAIL